MPPYAVEVVLLPIHVVIAVGSAEPTAPNFIALAHATAASGSIHRPASVIALHRRQHISFSPLEIVIATFTTAGNCSATESVDWFFWPLI
jgi:hypothetical protein